ncbi:homeotic protein spalt-major-like [Trichogramma pretiosum]|uniref:homeotic protein spalt-major-like n=1 Tax=Trichogramma pretiosum TaxID=7493 RepID=UPI000C71B80E|nr:homeotic protein spalt-major-like [Trichogramma pretiosum]
MDSCGLFSGVVRVKNEPCDVSFTEDDYKTVDNTSDTKHFQHLTFLQGNTTQKFQEYDENRENELDEDIEIVVECQDVKPDINLLPVRKTDDYSQNYLRNMKYSEDYKTQPTIKTETLVKKEYFSDETTKLYSDCELREQNEKRSPIDKEHSDRGHMCATCGKKFSTKGNLKTHVNSMHNHITHPCDICEKKICK